MELYYGTNHPQLKRSHACDTRGVNHTRVGFLGSTRVYTHTRVHAHACICTRSIYIRVCFTCVHACMANVASMLASYLPFS